MKRLFLFLAMLPMLAGCGLAGKDNTITTTEYLRPDGSVESRQVEQDLSDDAVFYQEQGRVYAAAVAPIDCPAGVTCTEVGMVAREGFRGMAIVSGKLEMQRGMNMRELGAHTVTALEHVAPFGIIGYAAVKMIESPRNINMNGDGASYNAPTSHITGSTDTVYTAPYQSPPTITYPPEVAQ